MLCRRLRRRPGTPGTAGTPVFCREKSRWSIVNKARNIDTASAPLTVHRVEQVLNTLGAVANEQGDECRDWTERDHDDQERG